MMQITSPAELWDQYGSFGKLWDGEMGAGASWGPRSAYFSSVGKGVHIFERFFGSPSALRALYSWGASSLDTRKGGFTRVARNLRVLLERWGSDMVFLPFRIRYGWSAGVT